MTDNKMRSLTIAANTLDAYSADVFGPVAWVQAAQMLVDCGLSDEQCEAILRSKWTRWCRDHFGVPEYYVAELYRMVKTSTNQKINDLI